WAPGCPRSPSTCGSGACWRHPVAERTVRINILGNAKPAQQAFAEAEEAAGGFMDRVSVVFGGIGKAALAGTAVVSGALLGAGKALYSIGSSFDSAFDAIRVSSGATGEALQGLYDDFKT